MDAVFYEEEPVFYSVSDTKSIFKVVVCVKNFDDGWLGATKTHPILISKIVGIVQANWLISEKKLANLVIV